MELFRNLRIRAGRSMLNGRLSKIVHKPHYTGFYNIRTIGIVWDASKPEDFNALARFSQKMTELGKQVRIFGYYPGKSLPDQFIANRIITCLKRKEVDFFYRPATPEANSFIKEKLDVLIDINFSKQFTLEYITVLSQASLKVGLAGADPVSAPFDLMISFRNPPGVEKYLEQVLYYLEMINSETIKKAV
ncbi:MAG TPA: hypothetical protein PLX08_08085 [Bacteroidales bacterium]|jgi:hypothetical protein|nr:hypothetical protein [Bacteroidales bacterium]